LRSLAGRWTSRRSDQELAVLKHFPAIQIDGPFLAQVLDNVPMQGRMIDPPLSRTRGPGKMIVPDLFVAEMSNKSGQY
jgi:hypothetical protein